MLQRFGFLAFLGGVLLIPPDAGLRAQSSRSLRVEVADLKQDFEQIERQVKKLRLEIEELRRENSRLRATVREARNSRVSEDRVEGLEQSISSVREEFRKETRRQKERIISEVSGQIDALAEETQRAIDSIAEAVESEPEVSTPVRFSEDYPKNGVTYTVRSGDTLSRIAREHGSSIKHIQNANRIVNPARDLRVGDTIFIPIPE